MARFLPPLWLFGAVLYTAGTLLLVQPFQAGTESGALIIPINETLKAKQPPPADLQTGLPAAAAAKSDLPPLPRPKIGDFHLGQWVQVAHYTAVLHARPGAADVLGGSPVGEPFRVVALDGDYARVQDLGSGQFGWMRRSDLTPYTDGYGPRGVTLAPLVAAAIPPKASPVAEQKIATAIPAQPAPSARRQPEPSTLGPAPAQTQGTEKPKASEPVRVALDDSFGSILQRAFSGAH